jgi:hypothetical protein
MFRSVPAADYGATDTISMANLALLAEKMVSPRDPADPKDGPDTEESGIPALFTYFGQFIDHDLTFDPSSSLQKQNDPDALEDYRTPRFDMDNLYGRGPDDQPYMFGAGNTFLQGPPMAGASTNPNARDLPRSNTPPLRAIIGDPRNDENVIVSQLQGLWHRFHNKLAASNPTFSFAEIQTLVRFHYQWILLHDFLPTIIHKSVWNVVVPNGVDNLVLHPPDLKFYAPKNDNPFMPLEFSAAAYRFGHSMVRPGYRLNDSVGPVPIFSASGVDMRGFQPPPPGWAIDWERFINLKTLNYGTIPPDPPAPVDPKNTDRLQLAYRIDTSVVNPLSFLPASIAPDPPPILAQRNLERGFRMRLACGQDIARAMGLAPLADSDIQLGKFTGDPDDTKDFVPITSIASGIFADNCPLWTYVLAETRHFTEDLNVATLDHGIKVISTPKLGAVGGRIVAETFLGILMADGSSYPRSNPLWKPTDMMINGVFGLREFVQQVLS